MIVKCHRKCQPYWNAFGKTVEFKNVSVGPENISSTIRLNSEFDPNIELYTVLYIEAKKVSHGPFSLECWTLHSLFVVFTLSSIFVLCQCRIVFFNLTGLFNWFCQLLERLRSDFTSQLHSHRTRCSQNSSENNRNCWNTFHLQRSPLQVSYHDSYILQYL